MFGIPCYEEGNPAAAVVPDVSVVLGASNHRRASYLLWQEAKAPDFVLEVTSRSTRKEDQGLKRELYRRLGMREYWRYDPTGDYLEPALQGCELREGEYEGLPAAERGAGRLVAARESPGVTCQPPLPHRAGPECRAVPDPAAAACGSLLPRTLLPETEKSREFS